MANANSHKQIFTHKNLLTAVKNQNNFPLEKLKAKHGRYIYNYILLNIMIGEKESFLV